MFWKMHALRCTDHHETVFYNHFGHPLYARAFGTEPLVEVAVTEDPLGPYFGWIPQGSNEPEMIQPHYDAFAMQFTYGPVEEVLHGKGRIVRLTVAEIKEAHNQRIKV